METNLLLTFEDYKANMLMQVCDTPNEMADVVSDLYESLADKDHWGEFYMSGNKSVSARFCNGEQQMRQFLLGCFNSTAQKAHFDEERCSNRCLETLKAIGLGTNGVGVGIPYTHEPVDKTYSQGEILHNLNGMDYRVLEKLSAKNLLLLNEGNGQFVVAVGVSFFVRFPKEELPTMDNKIYGIEWEHGVYYCASPSSTDFQGIREEYGEPRESKTLTDFRNEQSEKFYMLHKIARSPLIDESVKEAAQNSMYEIFSTEKEEVFKDNLSEGMYDYEFYGAQETRKDKVR